MSTAQVTAVPIKKTNEIGFALAVAAVLSILFVPIPAFMLDVALALSFSLAILILMVSLWIEKPLDFSAFPLVLLVTTMLRLALNVATTRLILTHGHEGTHAAGNMVGGFARLVMGDDFVIGSVVFVILLTVNFIVISKGATRIAEVGARFTLDAIPGKQMAIDADLNSGLIDDKEARIRRSELEQESAFYGSMDGASKFVRGDAIAGLIITFINSFGGIIIGVTRHGLDVATSADMFIKLTVGDGLVTQIPALIVSLAAGLLVSKGGNRGTVQQAVIGQLGGYPRALGMAAGMLAIMSLLPGLPFFPFAIISAAFAGASFFITQTRTREKDATAAAKVVADDLRNSESKASAKELLRVPEIQLCLGRQLSASMLVSHGELAQRVVKMRKKFAHQYGFVIPDIKLSDDLTLLPKQYVIKVHGTLVASYELQPGSLLVVTTGKKVPDTPGDIVKEPAFGLDAMWVPEVFSNELRGSGFNPIDTMSVMLTHLSEVVRNNLALLLSYRDVRGITDTLEPEYKKLLDEIVPGTISFSTLQAVLRLLLSERVSIRNLHQILEAVAEVVPHTRKPEQIQEHVRIRLAQQICGDISEEGVLRVLRLGSQWDSVFLQALRRDQKGEIIEFDIDPKQLEGFVADATKAIKPQLEFGASFAISCAPEARPYVHMVVDRVFPNLPVLSHIEVAKALKIELLSPIS
ncbi:MAG: flagellar biosynthesis protein FlhA [Aestuariivirga sp.]